MASHYKRVLNEDEIMQELFNDDELSELSDLQSDSTEIIDDSSEGETEIGIGDAEKIPSAKFVTNSGRVFLSQAPRQTKRDFSNIYRDPEGVTQAGKTDDIRESFLKYFTPEIISIIVQHSNEEAERKNVPGTNEIEMYALIGILIMIGVNDDTDISLHDLWSNLLGRPVYQGSMSRNRILQLLSILRFDDKDTRPQRREHDKFAPFREVFEKVNESFTKYFRSGPHNTIDEMLCLFRGRCPFKVFMKEKPGKYGILVRILSSAVERYIIKMEVYAGKDNRPADQRGPLQIVKRLADPIRNTGYNITTDRFYTSVALADILYTDFKLTLVGTLKSNSKDIPAQLKITSNRERYSSMFAFTDPTTKKPPVTLVSYITKEKPKKNLLMLSTQHRDAGIEVGGEKKKTHINLYYNTTKGGVDSIDQMARAYSVKRGTRRWPLSMFYSLIDIAAINSYTLFKLNVPGWNQKKSNARKIYLRELSLRLVRPYVEERAKDIRGIQRHIVTAMEEILGKKLLTEKVRKTDEPARKARCYICMKEANSQRARENITKTKVTCDRCGQNLCKQHSKTTVSCIRGQCSMEDEMQ